MVTTHLVWMWKLLVVPVCSKSWIAAANTMANISSSESQCCGRANQTAVTQIIIIAMIQHHQNEFQQLCILTCKLRPQAFSSYWLQTDVIFLCLCKTCMHNSLSALSPLCQCVASDSVPSAWHQQRGSNCGRGFCACCSLFPELPQRTPKRTLVSAQRTTITVTKLEYN